MIAGFEARANSVADDHLIDGEVLADIAEEVEQRQFAEPVEIIDQYGAIRAKFDEALDLSANAGDVAVEDVAGEHGPLVALSAGITDEARRTANDGNRTVAGELET